MRTCIHCGRLVWPWQGATDPAGNYRDDVHKVCRRVSDIASERTAQFAADMNKEMGVPSAGEWYCTFHITSSTSAAVQQRILLLRDKYGITTPDWKIPWLSLAPVRAITKSPKRKAAK